ncbi:MULTISPECIES: alpha-D-ribose 1-methylphosphonate 5-triphosphate diphosphatase [Cyanophyceae]|uniref:alpha-D-ribose 1-methylphosphonate 5-triphosphate diphosphatase n=1 Tax=Cyanophyceae TaxID=3028117 RepID=UPI001686901A|nr:MULTISPECIES: alpha-D-ribose 1-methylphosphonate 5-triphosphate diphosphatase [Cyanophyceae]MBD1915452.1 alpha-D-ribose 1-methylphosphonate 5-triphosphate diphosphatase [Phormidium sp. FACHB-77]MBD2028523.1 alpha-D-ribose 1-methylphosphonate 5-triphosphate diphosphatase [Phormidium sp. FACHB-322]MBD2051063.1 alpha-D-ribose 1-methylphosphonate 5-triphosphate diphosphatase [Leptolyngbya sp. FACHB-60]
MTETIFTNYRLQLLNEEVLGTLVVRDGMIAEVQPGVVSQGHNGDGDYLLPGLVELHTDNFEQRLSPRPKVRWPMDVAAVYHDRDLAAAGITTVCDAIAVGDITPTSMRMTQFDPMINTIHQGQIEGRFAVDHRLHLRCELGYEQVHDVAATYADHPLLSLISLMDHTPGQRQFAQVEKYKEYYQGKHGVGADEMEGFIQARIEAQQRHADENRRKLVELTQKHQICLASHDDATPEHVQEALQDGAEIAEFPTTLDAAKEAHLHGLQVLMGAPNLILGQSHSGNVSAIELIERDLVDIISSDYVPQSLLQAMFLIAQQRPLYKAMQLFTLNPAKAIGLDGDRGSLEVGKRADFITVHHDGVVPRFTSVHRQGQRIA